MNTFHIRNMLKMGTCFVCTEQLYSKTCAKRPFSKRPNICFQCQLSLNTGQKYCRMLPGEHSAILSTIIKLPIVIKIYVLSIFESPFYKGFTDKPNVPFCVVNSFIF